MSDRFDAQTTPTKWTQPTLFSEEDLDKIETVAVVSEPPPDETPPHVPTPRALAFCQQSLF